MIDNPKTFLRSLFDRAVEVADPMRSLKDSLPERPKGRVIVVGAGKASARMAEAVEAVWGPCEGLVITRYGYARPSQGVEIVEAAHPVPDKAGLQATARMLALVEGAGEGDFVLALISGGASALLVQPVAGVSLAEKQAVNQALLSSGAPIDKMNTVRKHLSQVKGGQLAAVAWPAKCLALLLSDVPGDDQAFIGSGPTVGDNSTPRDALDVLETWKVDVPPSVRDALSLGSQAVATTDPRLANTQNVTYAAPRQSLEAAAILAEQAGCDVRILGDALEGEARDVALEQARRALELQVAMAPGDAPILLLSGGELTVTRRGTGIGGPNSEFCLALALSLNGVKGIYGLACDTDGVDGVAEVAGAVIGPDTLSEATALKANPQLALENNDAHSFFSCLEAQVVTGPTLTNVNDFRAILLLPPGREAQPSPSKTYQIGQY